MFDALVASEGEPDLVQISGGEPTLHPEFFAILDAARARPIRHVMINTNGLRIAREPDFVAQLAERKRGLEIYLQFDSLERDALMNLRGADLRRVRQRGAGESRAPRHLDHAGRHGEARRQRREIGEIVRHALEWRCVRGVTFQPVQDAGRNENFDPKRDRVLLSDIRRAVIEDSGVFGADDMIPLPCNPERSRSATGCATARTVLPVTSLVPREELVAVMPNTIKFEKQPVAEGQVHRPVLALVRRRTIRAERLHEFLCCLPKVQAPAVAVLRERVPRRDRAVHGPLQFLRRRREALLHPFRHAERADHPVRHLQPVLSQRSDRQDPRRHEGGGSRHERSERRHRDDSRATPAGRLRCS